MIADSPRATIPARNVDPRTVAGFGEEWAAFDQRSLDRTEWSTLFANYFSIFPFDRLPGWAQAVGWCLPLSHMVEATRALVLGDVRWMTLGHVAILAAFAAALFPLPLRILRRNLLN